LEDLKEKERQRKAKKEKVSRFELLIYKEVDFGHFGRVGPAILDK